MAISPMSGDHLNHAVLPRHRKEQVEKVDEEGDRSVEEQLLEMAESEDAPASEQWKYLQSTDEMSAAMAQFLNRRLLDNKKKDEEIFSHFDSILDEDVVGKSTRIVSAASNDKTGMEFLLKFANQMFSDNSDLVLVLRNILNNQVLDEVTKKKLKELLKEVETKSDFRKVKAGINCALKAKLFGKQISLDPRMLRVAYREFLFNEESPIDAYINWIGSFGYTKRAAVIDFFESALLSDINSLDPSCSRVEFGYYLLKLNELQLIKSTEHFFIKRILESEVISKFNHDEKDWLFFLMGILKNPHSVNSMLADVLGKKALDAKRKEIANILSLLNQECARLPEVLFPDEEQRQGILTYFRTMIGKNMKHELRQ